MSVSKAIHFHPPKKVAMGNTMKECVWQEKPLLVITSTERSPHKLNVSFHSKPSLSQELLCNLEIDPIIFVSVATVQTTTTCHTLFYLCDSGA